MQGKAISTLSLWVIVQALTQAAEAMQGLVMGQAKLARAQGFTQDLGGVTVTSC